MVFLDFSINNFGASVQATKPLTFLASSGDSASIKSGGTNANDLLFSAGGNERFRITSSGLSKVGSGITLSSDGDIFATGVTTSTTFVGDLTGDVTGDVTELHQTPHLQSVLKINRFSKYYCY